MSALELPSTRELHEHARRSAPRHGNDPPEVFINAGVRVDMAEAELRTAREQLHALVREAYARGVPMSVLARWTGLSRPWIARVIEEDFS